MKSMNYLIAAAILAIGAAACSKSANADGEGKEKAAESAVAEQADEGASAAADRAKVEAVLARDLKMDTSDLTGGPPTAAKMPADGVARDQAAEKPVAKGDKALGKTALGKGMSVTKEWYTLTVDVPDDAKSGSEGVVNVTLVPKKGWKINQEFPTKLTVEPPAGVKVDKPKQKKGDATYFSEKKATFKVSFTSSGAGEKSFSGKFKFAVCTDATCDPKTEQLAFKVAVK